MWVGRLLCSLGYHKVTEVPDGLDYYVLPCLRCGRVQVESER
jgi:hypothetical protein